VSGVAGVGTHENVELGVRNEVHPPQIRALEAPFEGKMSLLGFPYKNKAVNVENARLLFIKSLPNLRRRKKYAKLYIFKVTY
jgi:hypothetical protein